MTSTSASPLAETLPTLLTLLTTDEREAQKATLAILAEAGPEVSLENCPPGLLAAWGRSGPSPEGHSLGPAERLALVLIRCARLGEDRAAEIAGLPIARLRAHLAAAESALEDAAAPRALVLEDHVLTREMLAEQSAGLGVEIIAATGRASVAVAAAEAFAPSLAIVDIDLEGAELAGDLAAMRIREVAPACHVLFVTGYPEADRIAGLMRNASALIKPFGPSEFSTAVRQAL